MIPDSLRACSQWPDRERSCLRVRPFRGNFGGSRLCQIGLILDHEIIGRKPDVEGLLFHFYGLLLKNAALDGGFISRPSLLHSDIGVGDFQANLILELLAPRLSLPDLQFIANGIRLRDAIPQRQRQLEADAIGWEIISENLSKCGSVAAGIKR